MFCLRVAIFCFPLILSVPGWAQEQAKIALLVGNKAYDSQLGPLLNPHNDVALVASALRKIGFKETNIHIFYDQGRAEIRQAVRAHAKRLRNAGRRPVGFFYYSGHGAADMESRTNYIIPVDAKSRDETLWDNSVPLSYIIGKLRRLAPNTAHFVIFDACRNELQLIGKKTVEKGFVPEFARPGMLIAYATDQGSTASDIGTGSGPYAAALAEELNTTSRRASTLFEDIKFRVYRNTDNKQLPWHISKFTTPVYLTPLPDPKEGIRRAEKLLWEAVQDTRDPQVLRHFLNRYRSGKYAPLARRRISELDAQIKRDSTVSLKTAALLKAEEEKRVERTVWETVKSSSDRRLLQSYVDRYPGGNFLPTAKLLIEKLENEEKKNSIARRREAELQAAIELRKQAEAKRIAAYRNQALAHQSEELRKARAEAKIAKEAYEAAESARLAALKAAEQANADKVRARKEAERARQIQLAALAPENSASQEPNSSKLTTEAQTRKIQNQLSRVGCDPGPIDGQWGGRVRSAVIKFNTRTNRSFDASRPSQGILSALLKYEGTACTVKRAVRQKRQYRRSPPKSVSRSQTENRAKAPAFLP